MLLLMHCVITPLELLGTVASPGTRDSAALFSAIAPWLGALLGVVIVGAVILAVLHKYLKAERPKVEGFTLQELRDLHRDGALSDEEFERAKNAMIGRMKAPRDGAAGSPPPHAPAGP